MKFLKKGSQIAAKQKKIYALCLGGVALGVGGLFLLSGKTPPMPTQRVQVFDLISKEVDPEDVRLSTLESFSDILSDRMQVLEKNLLDVKEEKSLVERDNSVLLQETVTLREKINALQEEMTHRRMTPQVSQSFDHSIMEGDDSDSILETWEMEHKKEERHVAYEIPAGTVVKAILVSGADCSVATSKPTGPNMMLLRPLDNGKLPKNVKVLLKGSIIIGNAIGDISTERVYVRAERMTLVDKGGSFIETDITAYVSGEDGREGMRGVVVDRSGQIITRAAFAAFFQGVGQTFQATLNNQTIEKLAETVPSKTILDVDMFRNGAAQGGTAALNKLAEYYIKRAEQLQPAIQIAAGRVVDIVFTKTVKLGEQDLKKKLAHERELKIREHT